MILIVTVPSFTLGLHAAHTLQELFYLLADAESSSEHEGGVVTTSSLAVELQAGGLTPVRMGTRPKALLRQHFKPVSKQFRAAVYTPPIKM